MKNLALVFVGVLLLSPIAASAQTLTADQKAQLIATLYAEVQQLEVQIQAILAQQAAEQQAAPVAQPSPTVIIQEAAPAQTDPSAMYKACATEQGKAEQEVTAELSNGGATQSYVNAMVLNQMSRDGYGYCSYL